MDPRDDLQVLDWLRSISAAVVCRRVVAHAPRVLSTITDCCLVCISLSPEEASLVTTLVVAIIGGYSRSLGQNSVLAKLCTASTQITCTVESGPACAMSVTKITVRTGHTTRSG